MTVDQSGSGSSGAFTIDVVGSASSSDTANGGGASSDGSTSVTATGTASNQFSYHLIISGDYANGAFAITSEAYNENGSYSSSQNTSWAYTCQTGPSSTSEWDDVLSGDYTLSWTAAPDDSGQLVYQSYAYAPNDSAHWHTNYATSDGGFSDETYDASSSVNTTGSGTTLSQTGTNAWSEHQHVYYPNPDGTPYDNSWDSGQSNPVSGVVYVGPVYEPTDGWQWQAATPDATNFTFHGVSSEVASLNETATYRVTDAGTLLDVNSFTSASHTADSSHIVDDEPGVPDSGSGTDLFHRDEAYSGANDVTGSGSYLGGGAPSAGSGPYGSMYYAAGPVSADFHAVDTASFAVADSYNSDNEETTGYDDSGNPYDLVFNFSQQMTGGGSATNTHDYHVGGAGLELVLATFSSAATSQADSRNWGTLNGAAFDDSSSTPESWSTSLSLPGDPGPLSTPDGMVSAFPQQGMVNPNDVFFAAQPAMQAAAMPPVPAGMGKVQDWYNKKIVQIGTAGQQKVANEILLKPLILGAIQDSTPAGGTFPLPQGTTTLDKGYIFAEARGDGKKLAETQKNNVKLLTSPQGLGWDKAEAGKTVVVISYAVENPTQNPRSGNVAASYTYITTFTGTKGGQPKSMDIPVTNGGLTLHLEQLEKMKLVGSP